MMNIFINLLATGGCLIVGVFLVCGAIWLGTVAFPWIDEQSPTKKFEKMIQKKCLEGNEIAIKIQRKGTIRFRHEKILVMAALDGNNDAIKALDLDGI